MTKRNKITLFSWLGIIGIFVVCIPFYNISEPLATFERVCMLIWGIYSVFLLWLIYWELNDFRNGEEKIKDDLDKFIDYCEIQRKKYWMIGSSATCELQLASSYMKKNELKKAKDILNKYPHYREYTYHKFVIAIIEEDNELAKKYFDKLESYKSNKYLSQKQNAERIKKMVETKTYDVDLYKNTTYPCIKELCLKYLNKTDEIKA